MSGMPLHAGRLALIVGEDLLNDARGFHLGSPADLTFAASPVPPGGRGSSEAGPLQPLASTYFAISALTPPGRISHLVPRTETLPCVCHVSHRRLCHHI